MAISVEKGSLVSITGGGGKTTLMYTLGATAAAAKLRVLCTTTTKIETNRGGLQWVVGETYEALADQLADMQPGEARLAISSHDTTGNRLVGIEPDIPRRLLEAGIVDCVICESDGARNLPLKVFGPNEPVICTGSTDVVVIAGLDIIGAQLDDEHVFRAGLMREVIGGNPTVITAEGLAAVLRSLSARCRKHCPDARHWTVLNKRDAVDGETIQDVRRCVSPDALLASLKCGLEFTRLGAV